MVMEAKGRGISGRRVCRWLRINRRRVVRWQQQVRCDTSLVNRQPGPTHPRHALLPEERQQILMAAQQAEYVDLSHRQLTVLALDQGWFFVSFSTTYRVLRAAHLTTMRGVCHRHNGHSLPPVRKELDGPNQRWCWDISYLRTYEKGSFLYLYLLLDEWSRKAIQWLVSWSLTAGEAKHLLDGGLVAENVLDLPADRRPEIVNDRGRQMKAKPIRQLFEDHQMPQIFARPRTPNDNPFIEAAFSTTKTHPAYPGQFRDQDEATDYFMPFFRWYNQEHYHSGIDYVTPQQAHLGLRDIVVAERRQKLQKQRRRRKEVNSTLHPFLTHPHITPITSTQPIGQPLRVV